MKTGLICNWRLVPNPIEKSKQNLDHFISLDLSKFCFWAICKGTGT